MTVHANARAGLKLLFIAEILSIVAAVLAVVPLIQIVAGLAGIAVVVVTLVGLKKAGADHELYHKAFNLSIFSLILAVVSVIVAAVLMIFSQDVAKIVSGILEVVNTVLEIVIAYDTITATVILLRENGDEANAVYGEKTWKIYVWTFAVAAFISLLAVFNITALNAIAVIGVVAAVVLELIAGIRYIIFLNRAKDKV